MTSLTTSWKKSRRSASENCVEARLTETGDVQVRDSKDRTGPVLTFTPAEWDSFISGAKDGEFSL
ncbi:MAG TPA: DUF397 domain-containing protein [Micromonosporaceae bacterium]